MNTKTNNYKCPCCSQGRYKTELTTVLPMMEEIFKREFPHEYKENRKDIIHTFKNADFLWACDACFENSKAIKSIPAVIETSGYPPLAYFDSQKECSTCKTSFVFSKEEQKFWYENLKFTIHSTAKNCVSCRETIRNQKHDNLRLAQLLKRHDSLSLSELKEIIAIYKKLGNEEKMNRYINLANKLKSS